jgi:DOPA 4,5-dioxygenase
MTIRETTDITGFHAHVYFDEATRGAAERLREELAPRFALKLGRWHMQPVGPHAKPMYEVAFAGDQFAAVVPWLMLNRGGLSILVHPNTDDPVADHEVSPLWLGEAVAIDVELIREVVKQGALPSRVGDAGVPHS